MKTISISVCRKKVNRPVYNLQRIYECYNNYYSIYYNISINIKIYDEQIIKHPVIYSSLRFCILFQIIFQISEFKHFKNIRLKAKNVCNKQIQRTGITILQKNI